MDDDVEESGSGDRERESEERSVENVVGAKQGRTTGSERTDRGRSAPGAGESRVPVTSATIMGAYMADDANGKRWLAVTSGRPSS